MLDLSRVGSGFTDPVSASQVVFRRCLQALSRPGAVVECGAGAPASPPGVHAAANALLLALIDQDCRLWLSPSVAGAAGHYRFHTGCAVVESPGAADFALVARPEELPDLDVFACGSDEYPDRSASVLLQLEALYASGEWRLAGPGIREGTSLFACGLGAPFVASWRASGKRFPRGIDLFLVSDERLCGLPRTTRIEAA